MAVERYVDKSDFSQVVTKINTKLSNRYTKADVDSAISTAIGGVTQFDYQIVTELPASGTKGVIYLVPNSGSGTNVYDEYIWIVVQDVGKFEKVGWRDLDLSGFLVGADVKADGTYVIKTADQSGNGFTISVSAEVIASLGKADTAVQKTDILGTTNQVVVTPDSNGNGVTISLDSAITSGAAAGATALQPGDVEPLTSADLTEVLAIITDDTN